MSKIAYCITTNTSDDDISLNLDVDGVDLQVVEAGALIAIVSETDQPRLRVSRANSLLHERVIEHVMAQRSAVLPLRFSTIMESASIIAERVLIGQMPQLQEWLEKLCGKCEVNLKAVWPREALFAAVRQRDPEVMQLYAQAQRVNDQIALGQRIEGVMRSIHDETTACVLDELKLCYQDYRAGVIKDDMMSMNGAFLIESERFSDFEQGVHQCDVLFNEVLTFRLVGPLAAYSFIDLAPIFTSEPEQV